MTFGNHWAGNVYGTNTGKLFLELEGDDSALTGVLRFRDDQYGVVVYETDGAYADGKIRLNGRPVAAPDGVAVAAITAVGELRGDGTVSGTWTSELGTGGPFRLFPHDDDSEAPDQAEPADQLHAARYDFGAVTIDREQIVSLAEVVQRSLPSARVVVVVTGDTQQARYLDEFKTGQPTIEHAKILRIAAQSYQPQAENRTIIVEFGPVMNFVTIQAADEAWVLGMRETLKREIKRHENLYATSFKAYGIGINQVLLAWTIAYVPSLQSLQSRLLYVLATAAIIVAIYQVHNKYIPLAKIYITPKKPNFLQRAGPAIGSWTVAATAALAAGLLAAYLEGVLGFGLHE